MRLISEREVEKALTPLKAIELARNAYAEVARGNVINPSRILFSVPDGASLYCMPAHVKGSKTIAVKLARVGTRNIQLSLHSTMATLYLFDASTGASVAEVEADNLTAIRTAASSAVATDLLANKTARTLGIIGAGRQAEAHVPMISAVRKLDRILVYSRTKERREEFAKRASSKYKFPVVSMESAKELVESSDILVLATTSTMPLFDGSIVRPGSHVNAVGSALANSREVDSVLMKRSILFVDSKLQTLDSYGDVLIPIREGAINQTHIRGEIGNLVTGSDIFRRRQDDITLFKSGGVAVLDAVAGDYLISTAG